MLTLAYLEFGTQTLPVRSLDTDTKAPSGKTVGARPLTSISWPGMEHLSLYVLEDAILGAPEKHTARLPGEEVC